MGVYKINFSSIGQRLESLSDSMLCIVFAGIHSNGVSQASGPYVMKFHQIMSGLSISQTGSNSFS